MLEEVDEEGEKVVSVRLVDEGRLARISETLCKKKLLKLLARAEGSSCVGKDRFCLLK